MAVYNGNCLHGYRIIGKTPIKDQSALKQIMNELNRSAHDPTAEPRACIFQPRLALQIESNDRHYDFLICFACRELEVYRDDELIGGGAFGAPLDPEQMNSIFKQKGVATAPQSE